VSRTPQFDSDASTGPCTDCSLARLCASQRLACEAFKAFSELHPWKKVKRAPTRALFDAIYRQHTLEEYHQFEAYLAQKRAKARRTAQVRGVRNGRRPKFVPVTA
jgi:hypothetical protein